MWECEYVTHGTWDMTAGCHIVTITNTLSGGGQVSFDEDSHHSLMSWFSCL